MRKQIGAAVMSMAIAVAGLFGGFYSLNVTAADNTSSAEADTTEETTEEESDVINESDTVFDEIGIDNSKIPDGYDEDSEENPNGVEYKTMSFVGEIFSVSSAGSVLYGHDNALDDSFDTFINTTNKESNISEESNAYRAAASGCFDGNGRKSDIAIVTLSSSGAVTLSITGQENKFQAMSSPIPVGTVSLSDVDYDKQNLVEITTGDFNGDGLDEVALMLPQTSTTGSSATVQVF